MGRRGAAAAGAASRETDRLAAVAETVEQQHHEDKAAQYAHNPVSYTHLDVYKRQEFQKSYAFFATNYGGMDMKFHLDGQWRDTPAGVAHFLEHKMFDTEDGNALQDLAANGASPNAFTS